MRTKIVKLFIWMFILALHSLRLDAQEIRGMVIDPLKEPLPDVTVQVYKNGVVKGETKTNYDGIYSTKQLDTGLYTIVVSYRNFDTTVITDVPVFSNQNTTQNFLMRTAGVTRCIKYQRPVVDYDQGDRILTRTLPEKK